MAGAGVLLALVAALPWTPGAHAIAAAFPRRGVAAGAGTASLLRLNPDAQQQQSPPPVPGTPPPQAAVTTTKQPQGATWELLRGTVIRTWNGESEDKVEKYGEQIHRTFTHGWEARKRATECAFVFGLIGILWMLVYLMRLWHDDRSWDLLDGDQHVLPAQKAAWLARPDLAFVLSWESDASAATSSPKSIQEGLKQVLRLEEEEEEDQQEMLDSALVDSTHPAEAFARVFCTKLSRLGFEADAFRASGDRLFITVALRSETTAAFYLERDAYRLQLQKDVVGGLGVSQPPDEVASSPPYIHFHTQSVRRCHAAGVITADNPALLYDVHHGFVDKGRIVRHSLRASILYSELTHHISLHTAETSGLLKEWYAVHSPLEQDALRKHWARWWGGVQDFSFRQPVGAIRSYFGSSTGFAVVWNGVYCRALFALAPVALVKCLMHQGGFVGKHWAVGSEVAFCVLLVIWSETARRYYKLEEQFYINEWHVDPKDETVVRDDFQGELVPSPVDAHLREKQFPWWKSALRRSLSGIATALMICIAIGLVLNWVIMFDGEAHLFASIGLIIQIQALSMIYQVVVGWLMKFENHKYTRDHDASYFWKTLLFQGVNCYYAFLYIQFKQSMVPHHCPGNDCMPQLRHRLHLTIGLYSAMRIGRLLLAAFISGRFIDHLKWCFRTKTSSPPKGPDLSARKRPVAHAVEEESQYKLHGNEARIDDFVEQLISLGFVFLFGAVAPLTIFWVLLDFVTHLRANAILLLTLTRRTIAHEVRGLGKTNIAVRLLMTAGMCNTGFFLASHGEYFQGAPLVTRVMAWMFFMFAGFIYQASLAYATGDTDYTTVLMMARRARSQHALGTIAAGSDGKGWWSGSGHGGQGVEPTLLEGASAATARGRWTEVPVLR